MALLLVYAGVHVSSWDAGASDGRPDAMSIDLDKTGNTATSLGTRQWCIEVTPGTAVVLDVTVQNIPPSNPMVAFNYALAYDADNISVTAADHRLLLTSNGGTSLSFSDSPPDSDGSFVAAETLFDAANVVSGTGVLSRLTLGTSGAAAGLYDLTLSENFLIDDQNIDQHPLITNNAVLAINTACPDPTPTPSPTPEPTAGGSETPTPTGGTVPTPTPTSTGSASPTPSPTTSSTPGPVVKGDVDCDGDVDAVDALTVLRSIADLPINLPAGCALAGDMDCDGDVDAVDALLILRFVAGLPISLPDGCPQIGV